MTRKLSILGATGSVGTSTLDLVERNRDAFEVVALTAATNVEALANAARRTEAKLAVVADRSKLPELQALLSGSGCRAAGGEEALVEAALGEAELVVAAIMGCAGLLPVMAAVDIGRNVALANKEPLVSAGALMTDAARRSGATLLPVDSEHNAIFQCLAGNRSEDVARLILTGSGGPFRTSEADQLAGMSPAQAVAHPNWSMGAKISVDSATLMNKGLELIEAHHLFGVPSERIDIVIHKQSVIHSMVEFIDGSVVAQLGTPDMRVPLAYALAWPERMPSYAQRLDLIATGKLDFEAPDEQRFPALRLAREALLAGGSAPAVLNAANEIAVEAFLAGRIRFTDIPQLVERALAAGSAIAPTSIEDVIAIDSETRTRTQSLIEAHCV